MILSSLLSLVAMVSQAGTEMTFVNRKNTYKLTGLELPNTDSDVKEDNIAAFAQYACLIPKVGNISAGKDAAGRMSK